MGGVSGINVARARVTATPGISLNNVDFPRTNDASGVVHAQISAEASGRFAADPDAVINVVIVPDAHTSSVAIAS